MRTIKIFLFCLLAISCNNQSYNETDQESSETKIIQVFEPTETSEGKIDGISGGCGFNKTPEQNSITLYQPRPRELSQIKSILKFSGLSSNFKIFSGNIENAVATIINNERYILYDPRLLEFTDQASGNYWSSMSILAHEIGHHLSGHTLTRKGSNPKDELEADKYSGFILYKLGATLSDATNAIMTLGSETGSTTHPPKSERIEAITKGWNEASSQISTSAIPPINDIDSDIVGLEFTMDDFHKEEDLLQYYDGYSEYELGPFVGYIISNTIQNKDDMRFIIEISQLPSKSNIEIPSMFKKNKRVEIMVHEPANAPNAKIGYLEEVLKPGNKLQFKVYQEGNFGFPFASYIKLLKRDK